MSCSICCESYTKNVRKPIECPQCKNKICLNCFKRHMKEDRNLICMFPNCGKEFTFVDISKLTENISFSNEIMDKLALITLDEEKNFLPKRQKIAKKILNENKFREREKERQQYKNKINIERYHLEQKLNSQNRENSRLLELNSEISKLIVERNNLNRKLQSEKYNQLKPFFDTIDQINRESEIEKQNLGIVEKEKIYNFVKNCSFKDCKGFLENNLEEKGWKCTICERFTCRKCQEPLVSIIDKDDKKVKHQCNPDVVANLKEMKKDTKPCPKCGHAIFKIDGCNSMFCIDCQTYFDWKTLQIYKKSVHNPDAVRWMREKGKAINRDVRDDICTDPFINNTVYYNWLYRVAKKYCNTNHKLFNTIVELINYGVHISEIILNRYNDNYSKKSEDFSVKYLLEDQYSEKNWTKDIRKIKKQQMFNYEWRNNISLLVEVMRSVMSNIRSLVENKESLEIIVQELELIPKIVEECNKKFEEIVKCFNSKKKSRFYVNRKRDQVLFEIYYK